MIIKPGVDVTGTKVEILIALMIAERIWTLHGQELVWTSGVEGLHKRTSRHYLGLAVDLRTFYFTAKEKKSVAKALRASLGKNYNVVVHKTHIHVSYKPVRVK